MKLDIYFKYFILLNLIYLMFKLTFITIYDFSTTSFMSGFMMSRLLSELSITDISVDCYIYTKNYLIDKINNISTDNIYLNWLKSNNNQIRNSNQTSEIIKNEFRFIINQIKEFTKSNDIQTSSNDVDILEKPNELITTEITNDNNIEQPNELITTEITNDNNIEQPNELITTEITNDNNIEQPNELITTEITNDNNIEQPNESNNTDVSNHDNTLEQPNELNNTDDSNQETISRVSSLNNLSQLDDIRSETHKKLSFLAKNDKELFMNYHYR